jgi:UrcA family protein
MTTTFRTIRAGLLTATATGLLAVSPAAQAAGGDLERSVEIDVSKVDFTSAKAVDHLVHRVHRVAMDICMGDTHYEMSSDFEQRTCFDKAVSNSLAQIASRRERAIGATAVQVANAASAQNAGD